MYTMLNVTGFSLCLRYGEYNMLIEILYQNSPYDFYVILNLEEARIDKTGVQLKQYNYMVVERLKGKSNTTEQIYILVYLFIFVC